MKVRDGESANSPLLGTFCGADPPEIMTTTRNHMYLKFVSDETVQETGFEAEYTVDGCGKQTVYKKYLCFILN